MMASAGNLYARCARCANRCRIRLTVGDGGTVAEARKQVPGRQTTYEECPNLSSGECCALRELEGARLITR